MTSSSGALSTSEIAHGQLRERAPDDRVDRVLGHLQHALPRVVAHELPELREVVRVHGAREAQDDALVRPRARDELVERTVVDELAVVDDDDARTELLDVFHVVARQDQRRAAPLVVALHEVAHGGLHRHVEADRRLVEEEHVAGGG